MLRWYLERETKAQIDEWELDATEREAAIKEACAILDRLSDYDKGNTLSAWIEYKEFDEDALVQPDAIDRVDLI